MENKWRIFLDIMTTISVIAIVIDYNYPHLSSVQKNIIYTFDLFVVSLLAIDFYNQLKKSGQSLSKYIVKHWYEIPSMMPLILFSTLEHQFLIGTVVRSIRLIGLFRIIHLFFRTVTIFESNRLMYIMAFAFTSVFVGAFAEYIVETSVHNSKINTFGDALWWSIVTVTTVGYGDIYPVTIAGRIIASILMIIGITILGLFISTLGNSLIESKLSKINNQNFLKIKNKEKTFFEEQNNIKKTIKDETKSLIKDKIDSLEYLTENELNVLFELIKTIYYNKSKNPQ
jgi:voltage-gated potassium channel